MTFYNLVITALPPLFVGIFEKDISEATIEKNPKALKEVAAGVYFCYKTIFAWLVSAIWHSLVVFFFGIAVFYGNNNIVTHGRDGDLADFQNSIQTSAVIVPLLKFALETITWNGFIFFGIYGSMAAYFVILAIESTLLSAIPSQYNIFVMLFLTPPFYFMVFGSIVVALTPDFLVKYMHRQFYPDNWQILQESELKIKKAYLYDPSNTIVDSDKEEKADVKVKIVKTEDILDDEVSNGEWFFKK